MVELKADDGSPYRAFVCQTLNPHGFPAKDRSGRLDMVEEPHLGRLMAKIRSGPRHALPTISTADPHQSPNDLSQGA